MKSWRKFAVAFLLALMALPAVVSARRRGPGFDPAENIPQISVEKSGTIPTKQGLCLRLNTDPGNVHIFTNESTQVSYRVVVEADSRDPGAEDFLRQFTLGARRIPEGVSLEARLPWRKFPGQFGVSFEIHVPRQYCLKINTQGGNIEVQDIEGQVDLVTGGGNITVGSVGPRVTTADTPLRSASNRAGSITALLETQGGNIAIGDVAGTLRATTSGGHITTGNIGGDAILRTGGGQIQTGRITGVATLETGGGNVRVARSGSSATADTSGGQIDFGEAAGAIHAQTRGGAVHIDHVTGPTVVETSGGGIFLRQVDAPLRVLSGEGDIVVYLPTQLAATIDAVVERGGGHSIVADPSLPLQISYPDSGSGPRTIRGEGNLNGGGEVLNLKAVSGNIILKLGEPRAGWNNAFHAASMQAEPEPPAMQAWNSAEEAAGFFEEVRRRMLESWWGGIPVDAGEMQNHLEHSVAPVYPEVARSAGIEGDVTLRVYVSGDGHVTNLSVLDGPPILARAAVEAVQQWQYQAPVINGRPANVVTTLVVAFRLK
jgi:TonB family protein